MNITYKKRTTGGYWAWDADNPDSAVIKVEPITGTGKVGTVSQWVASSSIKAQPRRVYSDTRQGAVQRFLES